MAAGWYYVNEQDEEIGPVDAKELRQQVIAGVVQRDSLIWREDLTDWIPAGRIKKLFEGLPAAQATRRAAKPSNQDDEWASLAAAESSAPPMMAAPVIKTGAKAAKTQKRRSGGGRHATGEYATFGTRFVADIVDNIIFMFGYVVCVAVVAQLPNQDDNPLTVVIILGYYIGWAFLVAALLSSEWQGTPGKKLLGLIVTDEDGDRIGFGKAFYRVIAKNISIGIALVALISLIQYLRSETHQFMHDQSAKTLVFKRA